MISQMYGFLFRRTQEILGPGGTMLDLGCGTGLFWKSFLMEHPQVQYIGVDLFPGAELSDLPNVRLHRGDCTQWAVLEAILGGLRPDIIVSKSVIEHVNVRRRSAFLKVCAALLSKGRRALIQYDQGHFMLGLMQDAKNAVSSVLHAAGIFRRFQYARPLDVQRFEAAMHDSGFRIVAAHHEMLPCMKYFLAALDGGRARIEELLAQLEEEANAVVPRHVLGQHLASIVWELERSD